ncbi:hypothetical protein S40293_11602 [Stachybotrys chartarum IBT 40293]|nr:hypothetical protein S40293_11602 [Stachybotrys chartarum IBT 40293]
MNSMRRLYELTR